MSNAGKKLVGNWSLIIGGALAVALIGLAILYKYTGDFTGAASFDTRGQNPASPTKSNTPVSR
jgi:hypothetical protein